MIRRVLILCALAGLLVGGALQGQIRFKSPQPGDIYREYSRVMDVFSGALWRVNDPNVDLNTFPQAAPFIPNPQVPLNVDDLTDAVRAEAVITIWGGHIGTTGKSISFNGNTPISIPELGQINGIPQDPIDGLYYGVYYINEVMVTVDVPLSNLVVGTNTFQGNNTGQATIGGRQYSFGWGHFGWYALVLRVYYSPSKPHPTGQITSPLRGGTMGENPTITASVSPGTDRVDFLAYYDGYDTDGDGVYQEYHHDYHVGKNELSLDIKNHVGTATSAPYQVTWNTQWIPDQVLGSVKMIARIRDSNGMWFVTQPADNLSLMRVGSSVKLYKAEGVPEDFWIQEFAGTEKYSRVTIPGGDNLANATGAKAILRTWNAIDEFAVGVHYTKLNDWTAPEYGEGHYYSFDVLDVPTSNLVNGANTFTFHCEITPGQKVEHGIEVDWPGPAVTVRYAGNYASPQPVPPTLASPADNATNQNPTITLRWNPALTAQSYRLQVASDAGFSTIVFDDSTIVDTTKQVGPLGNQVTYYWRVRSKSQVGVSGYSTPRNFTTFVAAAAPPTLVSPANNTTSVPTVQTLRWNASTNASSYGVQVGTDSTFAGGVYLNDQAVTDTQRVVSGLANATRYFWHVNAKNGAGSSAYGTTWNFTTTAAAPGSPALFFPPNNAINQPTTNLMFQWHPQPGTIRYSFQLGTDSTFATGLIKNDTTLTDTFRVVNGLTIKTRYFWRVSATNAGGNGPFSPTWVFTSVIPLPAQVSAIGPADLAVIGTDSVRFSWYPTSPLSDRYWFELAVDPSFTFVGIDTTVSDTTKVVHSLLNNQAYYWRVRGGNGGGWGPFSITRRFNTLITSVGEGLRGIPQTFVLGQNYPNPFNPSTQIEFGVPKESHVKVEIFNVLGERVALLVDETRAAGYYTVQFNAGQVSSGLYLYRLTTAETSIIKKMMLLK